MKDKTFSLKNNTYYKETWNDDEYYIIHVDMFETVHILKHIKNNVSVPLSIYDRPYTKSFYVRTFVLNDNSAEYTELCEADAMMELI